MRRMLLIALLLAAIVPVGCGGSDDEGSSSTTGTSTDTAQSTTDGTSKSDGKSNSDGKQSKGDSNKSKSDGSSKDDSSKSTGGATPPAGDTTQSEPSGSATPLARKAYIRKADRACRQFGRRTREIPEDATDPKQAADNYRRVATEGEELYRDFAALPKPRGDERPLTRYQALLKDNITVTKQIADAIEKNDEAKGRNLIQSSHQLAEKSRRAAESYGFQVCS